MNKIEPRENVISDGIKVITKHLGQKRSYGDSFYEYDIIAEGKTKDEVYAITQEHCRKCTLSNKDYQDEYKAERTARNHFRERYFLTERGNGIWFYQVVWPWTG